MKRETQSYSISWWIKFRRHVLRFIFRPIFHLLFKIKISGLENIPKEGSYVLAFNHVSLFEPPFILTFWPSLPEALAGHDVWDRPGQGLLVMGWGGIPVRRGEYDRETLETMVSVLHSGYSLMISPEGGRSHEPGMRQAKAGVAYMVDLARVPVLPVAIKGTHDDSLSRALRGQRDTLEMQIGEAFSLPPIEGRGAERREMRQHNADAVLKRIGRMLPERYHGVYAGEI